MSGDAVRKLERWERQGGVWRVLARSGDTVTVALMTCSAGEEVDRFTVTDPALTAWISANGKSSAVQ